MGHQTLAEAAAGQAENDPYAAIESLVRSDSTLLAGAANLRVRQIGQNISNHTVDGNLQTVVRRETIRPTESGSGKRTPGGPATASSAIAHLFVHRADYPSSSVRSVMDGLESLALRSDNGHVRRSAVLHLFGAGRITAPSPEPGLLARLKQIYARTSDPEVRVVVVMAMGENAERRDAVAFLEGLARQDPASEDFPNAALWALRVLPGMGDEGRAALKSLHESKAVRHPEARHGLSVLAEDMESWAGVSRLPVLPVSPVLLSCRLEP